MIEQLEIRNYRALRRLRVSDCGRLNLVVGRNGCGKTSLLEAVFLLSGAGDAASLLDANAVRLDAAEASEIEARHRSLGNISVQVLLEAHPRVDRPFPATIVLPSDIDVRGNSAQLGELRRGKRGDVILEALQAVEPRLQGIDVDAASGSPMVWCDIGLDEPVPLPAMGAGVSRLARLLLAIAGCSGGVVLADEIESGLHHSALPTMWRVVAQAAEEFDTQVFATPRASNAFGQPMASSTRDWLCTGWRQMTAAIDA